MSKSRNSLSAGARAPISTPVGPMAPGQQALYGNSFVQRQSIGEGPVLDLNSDPASSGATVLTGLMDLAEGEKPGSSGASKAVSVMSGVATALTHDATQPEGPAAWAERIGHGAIDTTGA